MDEETTVTVNDIPEGALPSSTSVRATSGRPGTSKARSTCRWANCPKRLDDLPLDDDMYVICRTGGRSNRAVAWLNQNGFDAFDVAGGMGSWNLDNGKPIVSETGEEPWVK
jgi:rhodanese-related sulfurtransferase